MDTGLESETAKIMDKDEEAAMASREELVVAQRRHSTKIVEETAEEKCKEPMEQEWKMMEISVKPMCQLHNSAGAIFYYKNAFINMQRSSENAIIILKKTNIAIAAKTIGRIVNDLLSKSHIHCARRIDMLVEFILTLILSLKTPSLTN
jgi:flagellar biosynthesis GTPase FlhF